MEILHLFLVLVVSITSTSSAAPTLVGGEGEEQAKFACTGPLHGSYPFCNRSLPLPARARSLVSLLTLPEKALLLSSSAAAIPRLGLPPYEWWSESLHGVASNGPGVRFSPIPAATSFPQVLLQSASFNRSLWSLVARAIAVEARAMYNSAQAGLTFWAPNVNLFRDPRWGRGQETPGEDPFLASSYAIAYTTAFQGEWRRRYLMEGRRVLRSQADALMLSACCKHYTAYDIEKWGNLTRYTFDAKVTEQDMEDTYQPPFRSCVREGRASCLMCSYNAVNGVPMCADEGLLRKVREEWGFRGYITSDCNAVATIFEYQKYASTAVEAVVDALKAGVDINCGGYYSLYAPQAVESGYLDEADIDRALFNLFYVQLRLGLFDGDPAVNSPYWNLGPEDVCTENHRQLNLEAARQGIVLLKNKDGTLPLSPADVPWLALIGPAGNDSLKLGGDYTGVPCTEKSLLDALGAHTHRVSFAVGCLDGIHCNSTDGFGEAVGTAKQADVVVVLVGLDLSQENEELDRVSLLLPGKQSELVTAVARVSKRPIVLLLLGGGPMDISFAKDDPCIGSILWVGYPGEEGGNAIADTIFGVSNPSGHLPVTWYPESFTQVPMGDMNMRANKSRGYPGRTYRFYTGPTVYEFGHGLSYSTFSVEFISVRDHIKMSALDLLSFPSDGYLTDDYILVHKIVGSGCNAMKFSARVKVKNEGLLDGSHVVLLYSRFDGQLVGAPRKQMVGFERVWVAAGRSKEVSITVDPCTHMSFANEEGQRVLALGKYFLVMEDRVVHPLSIVF